MFQSSVVVMETRITHDNKHMVVVVVVVSVGRRQTSTRADGISMVGRERGISYVASHVIRKEKDAVVYGASWRSPERPSKHKHRPLRDGPAVVVVVALVTLT
ncbi:hypothetical protein E2C01_066242 [Portunus trituberculatus]|uniref:Uncharacterized protein n=1 Tax=Portunus trituberculatus TaxID=210409 RepID=A0A5B7HHP8_PORTR|nr:hypothetical protein [Portunus trituberculatus]